MILTLPFEATTNTDPQQSLTPQQWTHNHVRPTTKRLAIARMIRLQMAVVGDCHHFELSKKPRLLPQAYLSPHVTLNSITAASGLFGRSIKLFKLSLVYNKTSKMGNISV